MEYRLTAKVILNPKLKGESVTAEAIQVLLSMRLDSLRNLMFKVSEVKVEAIEE